LKLDSFGQHQENRKNRKGSGHEIDQNKTPGAMQGESGG